MLVLCTPHVYRTFNPGLHAQQVCFVPGKNEKKNIKLKSRFWPILKFFLSRLDKIDPAIASVGADLVASSKLTQTYGLAFLVGAVQDILGEFLGKCRHPQSTFAN